MAGLSAAQLAAFEPMVTGVKDAGHALVGDHQTCVGQTDSDPFLYVAEEAEKLLLLLDGP